MSTQWFRRYQLITGTGGSGLTIDNLKNAGLRIKFEIVKSLQKEPNQARFEIFNLHPNNVAAIQEEYTDLIFNAGYEGNIKLLFSGNTQFVSYYRDQTDYITELICGDGDASFRSAFINQTIAAGEPDEKVVDACLQQMPNIHKGTLQLNGTASLRGRSYSGMVHETLDDIARSNGCNWSIQDGELQMVRADAMLNQDDAIVLNAETGLLEAAERTNKGISARCLLNPDIGVNSAIRLDNQAIRVKAKQRRATSNRAADQAGGGVPVSLNSDGIYKVFKVRHNGDTRMNDWYTEVLCVGLGQPVPTSMMNTNPAVPVEGMLA